MAAQHVSPHTASERVVSIDALRGFDMFWITGGGALIHALYRTFPNSFFQALHTQFRHVPWAGFRFYDLIFPLFLFIVGAVLPYSILRKLERGASRREIYWRVVRRTILLFILGLVYNGLLDFEFDHFRIAGVLQRIALCYFFAALIVLNFGLRGQILWMGGLLVGYWAVMKLVPVPGYGAGNLTPQGNLAAYIDQLFLPGRFCCYAFGDNEGILSTIPAVGTTLLGVMAGHWLRTDRTPNTKAAGLAVAGVASLGLGLLWSLDFPIIKNIWTSSYVLYAGGWSLLLLALFYWIIDVKGWRRWAFFFIVIGVNPITIYVLQSQFDFRTVAAIFIRGFVDHCGSYQLLVWVVTVVAVKWLFLYHLYRQRIFLRV